jgi:type III secretion system FlhB-like substrate exporter
MKKITIALSLLVFLGMASAQYKNTDRNKPHPIWHHQHGWIIPTLVGGVIVYEIARNQPPVIVQPTIIIDPSIPQEIYRYVTDVTAYDYSCSCWKQVMIPVK